MLKYKKAEKNKKIEKSKGNVFIDLGYPEAEAVNIVARLKLMAQIEDIIQKHNWTQKQAAKVLDLTQSRVSELISSRSEKFTVDMLMKLLDKLGKQVEIRVTAKKKAA